MERADLLHAGRELADGQVEIRHRCQHLADDGRCRIYSTRPTICRDYDCGKRRDCTCGGAGWVVVEEMGYEDA